MAYFSFDYMIERFGEVLAWHYLAEIERAAHIRPYGYGIDPEARLQRAFRAQDEIAAAKAKKSA